MPLKLELYTVLLYINNQQNIAYNTTFIPFIVHIRTVTEHALDDNACPGMCAACGVTNAKQKSTLKATHPHTPSIK